MDAVAGLAQAAADAHPRSGTVRGPWGHACAWALRQACAADEAREARIDFIRVEDEDRRSIDGHAERSIRRCAEVFRAAAKSLESRPYGTHGTVGDRELAGCPWCVRVRQAGVVWLPAGLFVRRRPLPDVRSLGLVACPDCAAEFRKV
ncbi:MAG: hypothetical protein HMLKMBBP_01290 [Planctomycetes bacterium]|nr:hypothetical protein [Planctomycetota bacterium]